MGGRDVWRRNIMWISYDRAWPRYIWASISRNPSEIECQYQWNTYRKSPMANRTVTWPITSCDPNTYLEDPIHNIRSEWLLWTVHMTLCGVLCRRILKKRLTWHRRRLQSHRRPDISPTPYSRSARYFVTYLRTTSYFIFSRLTHGHWQKMSNWSKVLSLSLIMFHSLILLCFVIAVCSVVVSVLASINVVNRHWARLLLGWVTAHGQVNRLGI